jgi:hypothetical protein
MARPAANLFLVVVLLAVPAERVPASEHPRVDRQVPKLTAQRLREKGWWPTRTDAARKDYAGSDSCAACHQQIAAAQRQTPMAQAAWRAADTQALRLNPKISLTASPFQTEITRRRAASDYSVARGGEAINGQILWSMGDGVMGQTFVVQSAGSLFESRLSYFSAIKGLDVTPGHSPGTPHDLEHAFGERLSPETAQHCFACHTTLSSVRGQFDPAKAIPGVTCEACHGPGTLHVKAMEDKDEQKGRDTILNPSALNPVELVDFCGACHRTPLDVAAEKDFVPINIRFQPYRLAKSRCWSRPDPRITCIACHDPHQHLEEDLNAYDGKCLACHARRNTNTSSSDPSEPPATRAPACPVSTKGCASCHMPRYQVPQMHGTFTDHDIRIVHPGDPYPL